MTVSLWPHTVAPAHVKQRHSWSSFDHLIPYSLFTLSFLRCIALLRNASFFKQLVQIVDRIYCSGENLEKSEQSYWLGPAQLPLKQRVYELRDESDGMINEQS